MWMARRWGGVAALGLLLGCGSHDDGHANGNGRGSDQGGEPQRTRGAAACPEAVVAWSERCAAREGVTIPAVQCPEPDLVLLDLGDDAVLRVEMRRSTPQSFRPVGAWGLSPVGNFPDWNQVDARIRQRFDRLESCVRADQGFAAGVGASARQQPRRRPRPSAATIGNSVPWLLLGALLCLLATLRGAGRSRAWRRRAAAGVAMALGALALRGALLPARFFHQNGQGPLWVAAAVSPQHHPYGPGYRAIFGWLRWLTREPDRGVFFVQGVLACLAVPAAAFVARRLGAHRSLCAAVALAVAVDPILGRLSRSESYYGLGASLLLLATGALAASLASLRLRSAGFVLPVIAAALLIAQHALVHPIGWLAAALCPAVLLLAPGHWRRRARRTAAATLLVAAVVAMTAGPAMFATLHSPFGSQWTGGAAGSQPGLARLAQVWKHLPIALAALTFVAAGARSWRRGALQATVLLAAVAALLVADIVGSGSTRVWIHQAYLRLYAPAALVLLVSSLQRLMVGRWPRIASTAAVASLAVAVAATHWSAWTTLPTDAQEQELALRWRSSLPTSSRVAYVERIGRRVLTLPIYDDAPDISPTPLVLRMDGMIEDLARVGQETFYVRTSLCSTREGRDFCTQLEGRYRLTPVHEVELPAIPSMVGLGYDGPTVRTGLYRVSGARADGPPLVTAPAGP
jgi:hypothetical protein